MSAQDLRVKACEIGMRVLELTAAGRGVEISAEIEKALREARDRAMEDAAKVAHDYTDIVPTTWGIADKIRALKSERGMG